MPVDGQDTFFNKKEDVSASSDVLNVLFQITK